MENSLMTRDSLERLTNDELVKMADLYGLDIPPGLDRVFIIEELLEIALDDWIGERDGPLEGSLIMETGFLEPVPLPKQYNITFIEVIIRDPLWAFAFWEVKGFDKELFEKSQDFGGYYLKVSPWKEPSSRRNFSQAEREGVFTVPVETDDAARYLGFPPAETEDERAGRYGVELCAQKGTGEFVLAASQPFRLPPLPRPPARTAKQETSRLYKNPLICLSGAGDFHIIRNLDRSLRPKTGGNS
jgi:hypothetical protein